MALLEIAGLSRRPWFEAIDLTVNAGEIVCVRGPSGCGKSLLLRAVADLDPVDAGTVRLDGVEREQLSAREWRRRVTYVHQTGVRFPGSAADNVARVASLRAVRRARSAVGAAPEPASPDPGSDGVVDMAADAAHLSGGEAQIVALLRALSIGPQVLLLDEPTSALDDARAERWHARLRAWVGDERAALWVTHDAELATALGAREVSPW